MDLIGKRVRTGSQDDAARGSKQVDAVPGRRTLVGQDATPVAHHQLPPPGPNEAPEVATARQLLDTITDPSRQLLVIRKVLDQASISPHKTAEALLRLLLPFGQDYPAVASVLRQRLAELQIEKPGTGTGTRIYLDEHGAADAAAFNAKHASNVQNFGTATSIDTTDVQAIAAWQKAHGLDPDGKIGSGTLQKAQTKSSAVTTASTTEPTTTTGTTTGATTGTASNNNPASNGAPSQDGVKWYSPDAPHEPPAVYLSKNATIAADQKARRMQQYQDDPKTPGGGYRPPTGVDVSLTARYREIRRQRKDLPREFVILMVGGTHAEQALHCINLNFFGMEGMVGKPPPTDGRKWTRGLTSAAVSVAAFRADPGMYLNWPGHPDVEEQAAHPPKDGLIRCMIYAPRPAYDTVDEAVTALIKAIMLRHDGLQAQGNPIANNAFHGDLEAYIRMLHEPVPGVIGAYNALVEYPDNVRRGVAAAKAELTDVKDD